MSIFRFFRGKVKHPSTPELYHYTGGKNYANPGAGAFIFQPEFSNPVFLFRGAGRLAGTLSVFQGHVAAAPVAVPNSGVGGTVAGQWITQGLSDANAVQDAYTAQIGVSE